MVTQELKAITPIDGRYRSKVEALANYFSEAALIRYRTRVELEYLIALADHPEIKLRKLSDDEKAQLRKLYQEFNFDDALNVKAKESVINHDVKAVEYLIKEKLADTSLDDVKEWVHFALTSEDINNISYALMLSESIHNEVLPCLEKLHAEIENLAEKYKNTAMLSRTHGQSASPTTFGKEMKVFSERLRRQIEQMKSYKILAKLNGATGNYNAQKSAYPNLDWQSFSQGFIAELNNDLNIKLEANLYTTQIEPHDTYAEIFDIFARANTILIDFNQDIWRYISDAWLSQKSSSSEVGSSTMPHKVNPIDFENSEGNLGLANALFKFFSAKLPISRLQRDLSDSTVLRNIGLAFAYSLIAYKSTIKGLSKISVNGVAIKAALDEHPEVIAEALQTILRREGVEVPYEKLKDLTRGKKVTLEDFRKFISDLNIADSVKAELRAIEPGNYVGILR